MRLAEILKITGFCTVVFLFTSGSISTALAEKNDKALSGAYIGFTTLCNSFGGEFDGKKYFDFGEEVIYVPKVEGNLGFGILLGTRYNFKKNNSIAAELGYYYSTHDNVRFRGRSIFFNMLALNTKYYFSANKTIQPFFNGELAWPWLSVEGGSSVLVGHPEAARLGNASFRGLALGIGVGIAHYPHPKISINAGFIYRWLIMLSVKGQLKEAYDIETLMTISPSIIVGITYTFYGCKK